MSRHRAAWKGIQYVVAASFTMSCTGAERPMVPETSAQRTAQASELLTIERWISETEATLAHRRTQWVRLAGEDDKELQALLRTLRTQARALRADASGLATAGAGRVASYCADDPEARTEDCSGAGSGTGSGGGTGGGSAGPPTLTLTNTASIASKYLALSTSFTMPANAHGDEVWHGGSWSAQLNNRTDVPGGSYTEPRKSIYLVDAGGYAALFSGHPIYSLSYGPNDTVNLWHYGTHNATYYPTDTSFNSVALGPKFSSGTDFRMPAQEPPPPPPGGSTAAGPDRSGCTCWFISYDGGLTWYNTGSCWGSSCDLGCANPSKGNSMKSLAVA